MEQACGSRKKSEWAPGTEQACRKHLAAAGMRTTLSAIMACYNGSSYLAEAIGALRSQGIGLEILVIDDASTDGSAELAQQLGATVCTIPHRGQAVARNIGLAMAAGDSVIFHDQDDVLQPEILPRMLRALQAAPDVSAVMAQAQDFLSPDLDSAECARLRLRNEPYFGYLGATLFRKEALLAIGGFSETLKAGEATDLLLRILASGPAPLRLPLVAMRRRIHKNNASRLMRRQQFTEYAASLRNHFLRARD